MEYPLSFKNLIDKLENTENENLRLIGVGNPNADILIIGKEPAINLDPNDKNHKYEPYRYDWEVTKNLTDWGNNLEHNIQPKEIQNWLNSKDVEYEKYNPLFPYNGQYNKKLRELKNGELNGGTSPTWCNYQKLIDLVYERHTKSYETINFHNYAFMTDLSTKAFPKSPKWNEETRTSIVTRCEQLFQDDFFRKFKVVVVACGDYAKRSCGDHVKNNKYDINLEDLFGQTYRYTKVTKPYGKRNRKDWCDIHKSEDGCRLLIHTRQLSNIFSSDLIPSIAREIREFLANS